MSESRTSMQAQIGYLTSQVENLDRFVRDHMNREEKKFASVHTDISANKRWMMGLTVLVLADSAGVDLHSLFSMALRILT